MSASQIHLQIKKTASYPQQQAMLREDYCHNPRVQLEKNHNLYLKVNQFSINNLKACNCALAASVMLLESYSWLSLLIFILNNPLVLITALADKSIINMAYIFSAHSIDLYISTKMLSSPPVNESTFINCEDNIMGRKFWRIEFKRE